MVLPRAFLLLIWIYSITGFEIELDRIEEGLDKDDFFDISSLRISRVGRGVYAFNGTIILKVDLDENIMVEVKAEYSASGSSKFVLLPLKITPLTACKALNTHYKQYLMESLTKSSDFPYIEENDYLCPLKAGTYNINMYEVDKDAFPKVHNGFYRVSFYYNSIQNDDKAVWLVYIKVHD